MASLVEELITTLQNEEKIYTTLIPIVTTKTSVIVENNLQKLEAITEREQEYMQQVTNLEAKRREIINNMGIVMGKNPQDLTLKQIIGLLDKQPEEQKQLSIIRDNLKSTVHTLVQINNHNKSLIEQSLEMIEFNMNFIQSTRMSPGNNYNKGAYATNEAFADQTWMFDVKQ
ncbi:hypothetical protein lbkm_3689 [Lachnospiraceae bacterium KM106-2]|nr:hypothetical protein lbkm_3689 [Lachnospiraceae bacterium KM106-2]